MQQVKQFLGFGALLWAILVVASLILRVYETGNAPLFESVKFIVLAGTATWLGAWYIRQVGTATPLMGFLMGLSWMAVVVVLDLILFALGLFNLTLGEYFNDVVSSYLVIPLITTIQTCLLQAKK